MKKFLYLLIFFVSTSIGVEASDCVQKDLVDELASNQNFANAIKENPNLIDSWKVLGDAGVDNATRVDPDFLKRFNEVDIPNTSLNHADAGDFTYVPGTNNISKMKSGGHGQSNLDILDQNGIDYNIVNEFDNGVRVGNVPGHKVAAKRSGTGQSWFPQSWTAEDISNAGKYVASQPENLNLADGVIVFSNFKGVRVGIIKTNGKIGTIFPDSSQ